jgi:hypothetical protein
MSAGRGGDHRLATGRRYRADRRWCSVYSLAAAGASPGLATTPRKEGRCEQELTV